VRIAATTASPPKTDRQPRPTKATAAMSTGPASAPSEPAIVQRTMFASRRPGSASMSDACESETNAPLAGCSTARAASSGTKLSAVATPASAAATSTPPPVTSARRRHTSPRIPRAGSATAETTVGTASRIPTAA
jgi:hypothetical protein